MESPPETRPAGIALRRVFKCFGTASAVEDLTLEVARGSVFGLLGPNGAGKTTTMRMATGILLPDRGTILHDGAPSGSGSSIRIGYLSEERGLYHRMQVFEQLTFFAALRGIRRWDAGPAARRWMERLDLGHLAARRTDELSKGMQQLLQVAVALVHDPEIVVLDEPFAGLDPVHVGRLTQVVKELRDGGAAILLSTHAMEQAEDICDRVGFLNRGVKIAEGSPSDLQAHGTRLVRAVFRGPAPVDFSHPHVIAAQAQGSSLTVECAPDLSPVTLIEALAARGEIVDLESRKARLRDVFLGMVR
ncbi:MAG: ATP-binding cassette domain-containing protein [Candidatus Eisenbacteria bacterium]|jgi:ABC-2 type transport system ATP-binding protein|nr:ATP-binding cassette domain-containing protein [Candidatus Eisenbacteria bacterium]